MSRAATGNGLPLLAAGGSAGVVALWNLEQRCLHHVVRDAHDAALTGLHFFAGEPRLLSAGADNSVKQWVSELLLRMLLWCRGGVVRLATLARVL
jgi:U3 small nucleolar RNA-associated protein 21